MEEDKKLWEFRDENSENKADFRDQMKANNDRIEDINRRRASIVANANSIPLSSSDRQLDMGESENG
jgi:hypothetical protein